MVKSNPSWDRNLTWKKPWNKFINQKLMSIYIYSNSTLFFKSYQIIIKISGTKFSRSIYWIFQCLIKKGEKYIKDIVS